jgi:hypothetical protein
MNKRLNFNKIGIDFIEYNGKTEKFSGMDSAETFIKNLAIHGIKWHYATKPISYIRNSLGYRSRELSEIDRDNFFLALGCSHTEGIGLALEESWPDRVAQTLNMDYLNHAKGGGGADLAYINSLLFLQNASVKPKFVVIQWPDLSRMMYKNLDDLRLCGINFPIPDRATEFFNVMLRHDSHLFNTYWAYQTTQILWKLAGVPVINWELNNFYRSELGIHPDLEIICEDHDKIKSKMARDCAHYGPSFYQRASALIVDCIKSKLNSFSHN